MSSDQVTQIGPYRVLETLGEGGMGIVYLAEQTVPVRRQVALKVLKAGADSEKVLARFEAERQALAVMDHPAIAKIFDAGVTEDGRSYFAMERVTGSRLTDYCDERRLSIRERVALFVQVCRAVQHAHQKGVIHRDLKPSNVLVSDVDGRPLPRIIDFGIAKATVSGKFDGTQLTTDDQVIGTPAYMSPEQIDGSGDIDTRSDIYALGVLLHEVLVGALPYDHASYRGWAAVAATLHRDPPTPGKRFAELADTQQTLAEHRSTTPSALSRELGGDVGWITSRAMDKDREQRYETATGMANDLSRYLDHEPVRARGANTAYVVRKFVRRNLLAVAFGSTVAAGLVAFSVVTSIQADRITRARDEAVARRGQAEGVLDFMLSDLREKLEPIGRLDILDDVGTAATDYFASIPEALFSDEELASRSQTLYQIGQVRLSQGRTADAEDPFVQSLRLAEALSSRAPESAERLWELGQSQYWVGSLAYRRGLLDQARVSFEAYRNTSLKLVSRDTSNMTWLLELSYSHTNVGLVHMDEGQYAAAVDELQASLAAKQRVLAGTPDDPRRRYDVSQGYYNLAIAAEGTGDLIGAREYLEADQRLKVALASEDPDNTRWPARLLVTQGRLSRVYFALGDTAASLKLATEQWASAAKLIEHDPTNATWKLNGALARTGLGNYLASSGQYDEGLRHLDGAIRTLDGLVREDTDLADGAARLGAALVARAAALAASGDPRGAETDLARVGPLLRSALESRPDQEDARRSLAEAMLVAGEMRSAAGDEDGAHDAWSEGLSVLDFEGGNRTDWRHVLVRAQLLTRLGRVEEATPLVDRLEQSGVVSILRRPGP